MSAPTPNKMMLGFVVRQCAVELGHSPDAAELAEWANNRPGAKGPYRVFGRSISIEEARVILRHPARPVTANPRGDTRPPARRPMSEPARIFEFSRFRRAR